jgi:hypothetical protein
VRIRLQGDRAPIFPLLGVLAVFLLALQALAQSNDASEASETIHGTVLNSVTREPISGALVTSPDSRFATRTDPQGRFEFTLPKTETVPSPVPQAVTEAPAAAEPEAASSSEVVSPITDLGSESNRPIVLSARKPGFLENDNLSAIGLAQHAKEITLRLTPEAVVAGHVSLPTSEAPDRIQLQLFRRSVQNGVAQWIPAGNATSKSNGDFRFADLTAGTYKLLTTELLDSDPLNGPHAQLYGYPPVYYPDADDFASAAEITLSPGETTQPRIELVKQPYFRVKIAVANLQSPVYGMNINVASSKGHTGPGYALRYNESAQQIEGTLPSGTYTVEAIAYGQAYVAGVMTLVVKGAPVTAKMDFGPSSSVVLDVKEEFNGNPPAGSLTFTRGQRSFQVRGPRRYLNAFLESADEFADPKSGFLREPSGPNDSALEIANVLPGRYWVRVRSSYGYPASMRVGSADLLREPLVVGTGGGTIPVDVVMRDDSAVIAGQVEELNDAPAPAVQGVPPAFVYCVPTLDSAGQFSEIGVAPDGSFSSPPLPPGDYRVLVFDQQQTGLEYRNPEAMKIYDGRGPVVHVAGGQTEHVTLQLSSTRGSGE